MQMSQITSAEVILDGAGWHTMDTAMVFSNLTLIKLSAYSPGAEPDEANLAMVQTTLSFQPNIRLLGANC